MASYLIINLRRLGDVLSSSHLIESIRANDPQAEITLLAYEEAKKAAKAVPHLENVHLINRKQLISLRKNKIFSNAFAINKLEEALAPLNHTQWDHIINYSNDRVAGLISSYLAGYKTQQHGISFKNNNIKQSNDWSYVLNDILTTYNYPIAHFQDCYHQMMDIKPKTGNKRTIFNPSHEETSTKNIAQIKKANNNKKIVAIQLLTASETKDIPFETLVDLTDDILASNTYYPIFLIAPTKEEKAYMERLNNEFGSSLISVEADFIALSSVLKNVDLFITPDTSVKHLADANEIPLLEIALGEAPFYKQGTTTRGNLILTFMNNGLNSKFAPTKKETLNQNSTLKSSDILAAIDYYFLKIDKKTLKETTSDNIHLYEVSYDQKGILYKLINQENDIPEIKRLISREILFRIINPEKKDADFYNKISNFDKEALDILITNEKQYITSVMKDLLASLRTLLKTKENIGQEKEATRLFDSLDLLLTHSHESHFSAIPTLIFSSQLEGLSGSSPAVVAMDIEKLLYKLKANLQTLISFLKELEQHAQNHTNEIKLKTFQDRRIETNQINA